MITLIGVGHVFVISENVKELIRSRRPEVVCLELDPGRYRALLERRESSRVPIQYRLLAFIQRRMASKFGTEVGEEMLAAARAASEIGAKVALIDMDASMVFALLWKRMSFKEKAQLMGGAVVGLFLTKEKVEKELEKYEAQGDQYMEMLGEGFPSVKQVLIDDRNKHMARQISAILAEHQNVVAVIGDGHVAGIAEALKPLEVETVRLKDVRQGSSSAPASAEYSSSFWYNSR